MTGVCKMCGQRKTLCHSHIVPEQCYQALYDPKHRIMETRARDGTTTFHQKGIREHLLCQCCEGELSKMETDFARYWYEKPPFLPHAPRGAQTVSISGFDYNAFKIFHLAILWRAGVSHLPLFRAVSLGPYEKKLRNMIRAGDAGQEDHFPLIGVLLVDEDDQRAVRSEFISAPECAKLLDCRAYSLCYAGCEWVWFVTDHPNQGVKKLARFVPRLAGTMLLRIKDYRDSISLKSFVELSKRRS